MPSTYEHNGVSFQAPKAWPARTLVAVSAPAPPGKPISTFAMVDEPLAEAETIRECADRILIRASEALEDYELLDSREDTLGGLPAVFVRMRVRLDGRLVQQAMTLVARETDEGTMLTTFTMTATEDQVPAMGPVFAEIMKSVRLAPERGRAAPSPRAASSAPHDYARVPIPGTYARRR